MNDHMNVLLIYFIIKHELNLLKDKIEAAMEVKDGGCYEGFPW